MASVATLAAYRGATAPFILAARLRLATLSTASRVAANALDVPTILSVRVKRVVTRDANVRPR